MAGKGPLFLSLGLQWSPLDEVEECRNKNNRNESRFPHSKPCIPAIVNELRMLPHLCRPCEEKKEDGSGTRKAKTAYKPIRTPCYSYT